MNGDLRERAAEYVLGTLEGEERAEFERALEQDPTLRDEVTSYDGVLTGLQLTVEAVDPPPHLRERILARARGDAPATPAPDASGGPPADATENSQVRPIESAPSRRGPTRFLFWALAASLLAALGSWVGYERAASDRDFWRSEHAALASQVDALQVAVASQQSLVDMFMGPELHSVSLAPPATGPSQVRVFWNHPRNTFLVTAFDLPPAPEGMTYQLWALEDGATPVSMGTFDTEDGRAALVIPVSDAIQDIDFVHRCGLTLEPAGGSAQPTGEVQLVGTWRHAD